MTDSDFKSFNLVKLLKKPKSSFETFRKDSSSSYGVGQEIFVTKNVLGMELILVYEQPLTPDKLPKRGFLIQTVSELKVQ